MEASKYLGRVLPIKNGIVEIPSDILETAQIVGEKVEILSTKEGVFIRTVDRECEMCGTNSKLYQVGNKNLCSECAEGLGLSLNAE